MPGLDLTDPNGHCSGCSLFLHVQCATAVAVAEILTLNDNLQTPMSVLKRLKIHGLIHPSILPALTAVSCWLLVITHQWLMQLQCTADVLVTRFLKQHAELLSLTLLPLFQMERPQNY